MAFNFKQYTANNPLLEELQEDDVKDIEAYGSADSEEMEGMDTQMDEEVNYDKVNAVMNDTLEAMRKAIKIKDLSTDDVHELRVKLAQFFA